MASVWRLIRASPKTGGCQPVVAGGVTKAMAGAMMMSMPFICWPRGWVRHPVTKNPKNTGDGLRFVFLTFANQTLHLAMEEPSYQDSGSQSTGCLFQLRSLDAPMAM